MPPPEDLFAYFSEVSAPPISRPDFIGAEIFSAHESVKSAQIE